MCIPPVQKFLFHCTLLIKKQTVLNCKIDHTTAAQHSQHFFCYILIYLYSISFYRLYSLVFSCFLIFYFCFFGMFPQVISYIMIKYNDKERVLVALFIGLKKWKQRCFHCLRRNLPAAVFFFSYSKSPFWDKLI